MQLPYIGIVDTTLHNTVTLIYANISVTTCSLLCKQILIKWSKEKSFSLSGSVGI